MLAIDTSYWQGHPDFAAVKAAGVGLVIMKAADGEGANFVDDSVYVANREAARAQDLAVGSYYFNGHAASPTAAADHLMAINDWRHGDVVAIDVEGGAGVMWNPAQTLEWVNRILAHGVPADHVLVYMSTTPNHALDWSQVAATGVGLWIAQYGANNGIPQNSPVVAHWPTWTLWQYSSVKPTGAAPAGLNTNLDLNIVADGFPPRPTKPAPATDGEETMTDMIYYADTAQGPASKPTPTGLVVAQESMWYSECPGAPLFPLTGNLPYTSSAAATEYAAFSASKPTDMAKRFATSAQAIANLIALRGTTTKPIGNFAVPGGNVTVQVDAKALAAEFVPLLAAAIPTAAQIAAATVKAEGNALSNG